MFRSSGVSVFTVFRAIFRFCTTLEVMETQLESQKHVKDQRSGYRHLEYMGGGGAMGGASGGAPCLLACGAIVESCCWSADAGISLCAGSGNLHGPPP